MKKYVYAFLNAFLVIAGMFLGFYAGMQNITHTGQKEYQKAELVIYEQPKQTAREVDIYTLEQIAPKTLAIVQPDIEEENKLAELELMAACVEAEAGNQSLYGKRLVADVILNRVASNAFPDTITEVIQQKNQFTTWSDGTISRISISEDSFKACRMELTEQANKEILYFSCTGYQPYGTPYDKIGNHYFSTR